MTQRKHKANIQDITIPLEKELRDLLFKTLQGDIVDQLLKIADVEDRPNYWKSVLEGSAFKVDEKLMKKYYDICHEVKTKLGFTEDVDFYITSDATVNAYAIYRSSEDQPHIINLHSSLIQLMTDDELRFVVGHEIGHLMEKHSKLNELIAFVYPGDTSRPASLIYRISLWEQLAELESDRYGFLAAENYEVCISALFKLAAGLDLSRINMDIEAFLEQNRRSLEFLMSDKCVMNFSTHPVNPIRAESLHLFAIKDEIGQTVFDEKMNAMFKSMMKVTTRPLDAYFAQFMATGGLIIANANDEVSDKEWDLIMSELSALLFSPKEYIENLCQTGDIEELFKESVSKILEINPAYADAMLEYMISIALIDGNIDQSEVDTVMTIGEDFLNFSRIEIAHTFARMIKSKFEPNLMSTY